MTLDTEVHASLLGMIGGLRAAILALASMVEPDQRDAFVHALEQGAEEIEKLGSSGRQSLAMQEEMTAIASHVRRNFPET